MKVYPLFQAGKSLSSKVFILEMKVSSVLVGREVYPLFQAGKSLSSVLVGREVYPLFQAGKSLSSKVFILEMKVYPLFFQAGKIFGITC